jgi:hypothetical protein
MLITKVQKILDAIEDDLGIDLEVDELDSIALGIENGKLITVCSWTGAGKTYTVSAENWSGLTNLAQDALNRSGDDGYTIDVFDHEGSCHKLKITGVTLYE